MIRTAVVNTDTGTYYSLVITQCRNGHKSNKNNDNDDELFVVRRHHYQRKIINDLLLKKSVVDFVKSIA